MPSFHLCAVSIAVCFHSFLQLCARVLISFHGLYFFFCLPKYTENWKNWELAVEHLKWRFVNVACPTAWFIGRDTAIWPLWGQKKRACTGCLIATKFQSALFFFSFSQSNAFSDALHPDARAFCFFLLVWWIKDKDLGQRSELNQVKGKQAQQKTPLGALEIRSSE